MLNYHKLPQKTKLPEIPTDTKALSPTKTQIPTQLPTISPTPLPTLTEDERLNFTLELLRTNANCDFPCWWGITPGVSTWTEVNDFFGYLGATTGVQSLDNGSNFHGTGGFQVHLPEGVIDNRIGILETDGIVELIYVRSESYSIPVVFQDQWANFSPLKVMEEYGIPSRVWLESTSSGSVAEGRIAGYVLRIFYDQLGFLVKYHGYGDYEPIYHFCPRFENGEDIRSLDMYLQLLHNPNPIEETAEIIGLEIDPYPHVQSFEDAVGLTPIEHDLFTQKDEQACFDTPRDIWP